jgi:hypothetical protein
MPFSELNSALNQLLSEYDTLFLSMGMNLFRALATIILAWFGIKAALSSAEGGGGFNFSKFASLVILISFNYFMISNYSLFYHLITDQAQFMADKITVDVYNDLGMPIFYGLEHPGLLEVFTAVVYFLVTLAITGLSICVFFIISLGRIAQGICIVLGPCFIPFFIVPALEWLFWGWFKSLIQYSFYQVVANAYIFVIAKIITSPKFSVWASLSSDDQVSCLPGLLILFISAMLGILKIPSIVNSIFSGSSGQATSNLPFSRG